VLWTLLDAALGLLALIALAVLCLRLWRQTKALGAETSRASAQLAQAQAMLSGLQGQRPVPNKAPVADLGGRPRSLRR
jgi:hypothetical protein